MFNRNPKAAKHYRNEPSATPEPPVSSHSVSPVQAEDPFCGLIANARPGADRHLPDPAQLLEDLRDFAYSSSNARRSKLDFSTKEGSLAICDVANVIPMFMSSLMHMQAGKHSNEPTGAANLAYLVAILLAALAAIGVSSEAIVQLSNFDPARDGNKVQAYNRLVDELIREISRTERTYSDRQDLLTLALKAGIVALDKLSQELQS